MNLPEGKKFYGSITVSESGQIVIPADARKDFGIKTGDKLLSRSQRRKQDFYHQDTAGFIACDSGKLDIRGRDINLSDTRRKIGFALDPIGLRGFVILPNSALIISVPQG